MPRLLERVITAAALTLALGQLTAAQAQAPTTAQRNAIRQSCASDYQSMCQGVPTGGSAALACLRAHTDSLSPSCQSAIGALSGGGQQQQPLQQPQQQPQQQPRYAPAPTAGRPAQACRGDFLQFCQGVRPGGGRALMCLRQHAAELSPDCQASLQSLRR